MKAITLWQPWASLLACGAKQYETRSWATSYRGPIAIHAAKKPFDDAELFSDKELYQFAIALELPSIYSFDSLPYGSIIATAELIDCHEIVRYGGRGMSSQGPGWLETEDGLYIPTDQEKLFGNWTHGRYAWEFKNMIILQEPISVKGKQGLWNWEGTNE